MSELMKHQNELSTDINTITAEINAYQRVAGEAIFEIGRRLKHVKENDLAHGEYEKWLSSIEINKQQAHRFVKVFEEFSGTKVTTSLHLGLSTLYEIATLPPEHREAEHVTSKGEIKTPDEMTVKELRELKRQLKETEKQAEAERKERERLEQENEELSSREPEVRVEYVEKEPEELYDRMYDRPFDVERTNDFYEMMNEVDELYRKYAHLKDSIEEIGAIAKYDDDLKKRYKQAQDLWVMLDSIFNNNNVEIIDVEII